MIDQVELVLARRQRLLYWQEKKRESYEAWELENKPLLDRLELVKEELAEAEGALRTSALEEYEATGNKTPAPGVVIKLFTRLIYSAEDALDWAIKHGLALKLDKTNFEQIAKLNPMRFVAITQEPQAQIATDLEKVLNGNH